MAWSPLKLVSPLAKRYMAMLHASRENSISGSQKNIQAPYICIVLALYVRRRYKQDPLLRVWTGLKGFAKRMFDHLTTDKTFVKAVTMI